MGRLRARRWLAASLLALTATAVSAEVLEENADDILIRAGYSEIRFDLRSGLPVSWELCQSVCGGNDDRRSRLLAAGEGYVRTLNENPTEFTSHTVEVGAGSTVVRFTGQGRNLEYRVSASTPVVELTLPPGAAFEIATAQAFTPEPLPGFGSIYNRVRLVQVDEDGQSLFEFDEDERVNVELAATPENWNGIRSRYWTLLAQPQSGSMAVLADYAAIDQPRMRFAATAAAQPMTLKLYAGPVEWGTLKAAAPELSEMLFAALWDFLRVLCFGMLLLLEQLAAFTGNYGLAIILLSLSVKILMTPLTRLADSWQAEVNRISSLLKPELDEIKRNYKGEEAHERTLAVYKKHDVSTLYTFKSAAGFLIQIPVFIAAFDMLAENIALNEVGFLWIADLARTDSLMALPFALPFFGGDLNLLPFLMTGLSVLAAWLQADSNLSPELQRAQSQRLYLMAAAFFFLFYTFPAGMVLYWTSSNLFHLLKVELGRLLQR